MLALKSGVSVAHSPPDLPELILRFSKTDVIGAQLPGADLQGEGAHCRA